MTLTGSKADTSNGRTTSCGTGLQHTAAAADPDAFDPRLGGSFAASAAALLVVGLRVQQLPVSLFVRTNGIAQSPVFRQQPFASAQQSCSPLGSLARTARLPGIARSTHYRPPQLCFHHAGSGCAEAALNSAHQLFVTTDADEYLQSSGDAPSTSAVSIHYGISKKKINF